MKQKINAYIFWNAVKKYAEEKNISYSAALTQLLPAYTTRFYRIDPPRRYPQELINKAKEFEQRYG